MPRASVEIEIPLHDVDLTGVGWHGHVYKYFEHARTELFRRVGLDIPDMKAAGVRVVITETRSRHRKPLQYGETITVQATSKVFSRAVQVDYVITNAAGEEAVRGRTMLAPTSSDGGQIVPLPDVIRTRLEDTP